jgi:ribosomal protein S18 acetylase RimI-like enzyme
MNSPSATNADGHSNHPGGTLPTSDPAPHSPVPPQTITFRDEHESDAPVVRRAHIGHWRAPAGLDLPPAILTPFLDQQHDLQERHIRTAHPRADRRMILVDGVAVGRICLDRRTMAWHIVDLALVAEAQGSGIGRVALRRVIQEAGRAGVKLTLEVTRDNGRAHRFYERAGFVGSGQDTETHLGMAYDPGLGSSGREG